MSVFQGKVVLQGNLNVFQLKLNVVQGTVNVLQLKVNFTVNLLQLKLKYSLRNSELDLFGPNLHH